MNKNKKWKIIYRAINSDRKHEIMILAKDFDLAYKLAVDILNLSTIPSKTEFTISSISDQNEEVLYQ